MEQYNKDSITSLDFREAVRKRMPMYLGSDGMSGVYNALDEIITNSIDEFNMGYGKNLWIRLFQENGVGVKVQVVDEGRGVPFGIKDDGSNTLVDIYSKPHTGGKFNNKSYQGAAGQNGIGGKATCLGSEEFQVTSRREDKVATAVFEEGILQDYTEVDEKTKQSGTDVTFRPDPKVFKLEPINIQYSVIKKKCKTLSFLTQGMTFHLERYNNNKLENKVSYSSKEGISDLVRDIATEPVHSEVLTGSYEENGDIVEVAFQWTFGKEQSFTFTNGLEQSEGGTSLTGMKTALTRLCKKNISTNLTGELARTGLVYVVNAKLKDTPSFSNQTKTKVNTTELNGYAQKATAAAFERLLGQPTEFSKIESFLLKETKAEEAAERARKKVKEMEETIKANAKSKIINPRKLSDAEITHDPNSMLFAVEGDSAAGTVRKSRNYEYQGVLELKGKMINSLTSDEETVLNDEEIQLLCQAIGQAPFKFEPKNLRYHKIVISADADSDGGHVKLLFLTDIAYLWPELLTGGYVYQLVSPLYTGKDKKGNYKLYYSEKELLSSGSRPMHVKRNKGLGSMEEAEMRASLSPGNIRLEQLVFDDEDLTLLRELMGKNVAPRKEIVMNEIDFSEVME